MWPKPKTFVESVPHCVFHTVFFLFFLRVSYLKWRIQECSFKQSLPLFLAFYDLNYDPRCVSMIGQLRLLHLQRLTIRCRCLPLKEECGLQVCVWVAVCGKGGRNIKWHAGKQCFFCFVLFSVLSLRQLLAAGRPVLSHHASQALCQGGPAQPEHVQTLCGNLPFQG